ncbi:hypothetical protein ACHAXT_003833 [Thalassiosira profunda]
MRLPALGLILGTAILGASAAAAFNLAPQPSSAASTSVNNRRDFLAKSAAATASIALPNVALADDYADYTTTESGMKYLITKEGDGAVPTAGQLVKAHYTGWLDDFDSPKKFDSSRDRGRPFQFKVGAGQVIRGWDEAFASMKVGERRKIILPSRLAYGDRGAGGIIPGGATLYFDVELLAILGTEVENASRRVVVTVTDSDTISEFW